MPPFTDGPPSLSSRIAVWLLLGWVAILSGCHSTRQSVRAKEPVLPPATGYLKTVRTEDGKAQLQIAIRRFTPRRGSGAPIWLVGVSHLGDRSYYDQIQRVLDARSLVLYEGVKVAEAGQPTPAPKPPASASTQTAETSLQGKMAEALGLVFQLTAIHYDRSHFRNSDISLSQLEKLVASQPGTPAETADGSQAKGGAEFQMLKQALEGGSWLNELAGILFGLIESSPTLQGLAKLALIEVTGVAGDRLESMSQLSPGMKSLMKVLVESRNQKVISDLRGYLKKPGYGNGIAIFYGAAHMRDFEHRLTENLGYLPREESWLTAVELDLRAARIGPTEERLLRSLINWDALK